MSSAVFQPFPMLAGRRAQVWRHQPAFRRPRHFHAEPELNLVARGSCTLGVGDKTMSLQAGELVMFAPQQDHVLLAASDDFDLFVSALMPALFERLDFGRALPAVESWRLSQGELRAELGELQALNDVRDAVAVESRLGQLFERAKSRLACGHVLTRRALGIVTANAKISSFALSSELGSGASAISRSFRRDLGVTFVEYRSRVRLIEFVRLVDRGLSFSRAALAAGFGSYAQCHRVFCRILDCSPRAYFAGRREHLNAVTCGEG